MFARKLSLVRLADRPVPKTRNRSFRVSQRRTHKFCKFYVLSCSTLPIHNAQVTRTLKRPDGDLWLNEEKRKPKLNPRPHCLGDSQFIVFICSPNEIQFFKNLFFSWKKTNECRRYYRLTLRQRAWINRVWKWIYCDWCSQRITRGSKSIEFVVVDLVDIFRQVTEKIYQN